MKNDMKSWGNLLRSDKQKELREVVEERPVDALLYIDLVRAPNHQGVFASTGRNFSWALFGRDSIEVAEDLLAFDRALAHDIILQLAKLQGVKIDNVTEEEHGKIHHEFRSLALNPVSLPEAARTIIYKLEEMWDTVPDDEFVYYGSVDATPLYVRLVGRYVESYGADILDEVYEDRTGKICTVRDSVERALGWIIAKVEQSPWRLLEYKRLNSRHGLTNQTWKDSPTAYMHEDGSIANFDEGIASIEVQGYVYDALVAAPFLVTLQKVDYRALAAEIQESTIVQFWMEDKQFFAQGLDRTEDGVTRQICTLTSNAGALLDTQLLLDLPLSRRRSYVSAVVDKLMDNTFFLTSAGIRCRDKNFDAKLDYVDYHGGNTVWPKETYDIAKGMRRHGYNQHADDLERCIVQSIIQAGEFSEFFYAEVDGKVYTDSIEGIRRFENIYSSVKSPIPESDQAWTISAFAGCVYKEG